jgi:hypothetical protein
MKVTKITFCDCFIILFTAISQLLRNYVNLNEFSESPAKAAQLKKLFRRNTYYYLPRLTILAKLANKTILLKYLVRKIAFVIDFRDVSCFIHSIEELFSY